jgi:GNAT superfamily N-acetyltransferase
MLASWHPQATSLYGVEITLTDSSYDGELVRALVDEVQQEYVERYGGPDNTPIDPAEFAPPYGAFLVAMADGESVGCAGLRRHDDDVVEIKRMFVRSVHRRRGLGRQLLVALEQRSRELGYRRVILETGTAQPEAIALYLGEGYRPIPGFGHYRWSPQNRCFAKDL